MKAIYTLCALAWFLGACRKQPDPVANTQPVDTTHALYLEVTHAFGNQPLELHTKWYRTASDDSLQVNVYRYFISNIELEQADGGRWAAPNSYFLVDEAKPLSKKMSLANVPPGAYTGIRFIVGVDSARNVSGAQTGALDPGSGMFWNWNTGYVMAMLEGNSPQAAASGLTGAVIFHCGGFDGRNSSIRSFRFSFPEPVTVKGGARPTVHLRNNLAEWFQTPWTIRLSETAVATDPAKTVPIADNYADMFVLDHVHNE